VVEVPCRSGNVERRPVTKELSKGSETTLVAESRMDQGLNMGRWSWQM